MNRRDPLPGDEPPHDPTLSRLYRELPDVAPSSETDALIRAAARRAVGAGPGPRRGFMAAHWRGMGSAAAALMLGVALTVQWRTQESARLDQALATAPAAAPQLPPATMPSATGKTADDASGALMADESPKAGSAPAPAPVAKARMAEETIVEAKRGAPGVAPMAPPPAAVAAAPPAPAEAHEMRGAARGALAGAGPDLPGQGGAGATSPAAAPPAAAAPAPLKKSVAAEAQTANIVGNAPRRAPGDASAMKEEVATAEARERPAARAEADRQAAPTAAPLPPGADYRVAFAAGRYAEALDLLAEPATPAARLDRELLRQWLRPGTPLECVGAAAGSDSALLCEGLVRRAAGQAPTPEWRRRVEASGLASGANAYRRGLLDKLFGTAP